jgi:DNA primase
MGTFNNDVIVKEIKRRLSIIDLVESYTSIKKTGRGYVGLCPFHDDHKPSMHIDEEKGLFHCFSCGAGGDILGFYMRYNNLSFPEALTELAKKANVEISQPKAKTPDNTRTNSLLKLNAAAQKFYQKALAHKDIGKAAREYLTKRNISKEVVDEFSLGYAPPGWDGLSKYLTKHKVPLNLAEKVGLIVKRKESPGYYDRFRDRIMFPITDVEGKVIGFGGRVVKEQEDQPKYLNSPESPVYSKRRSFYGLEKSREFIRRQGRAVLVEGYTDFLSLYTSGIKNVVATLGTSLTHDHVIMLRRYTENVVVLFDSDESGVKAAIRSLDVLLEEGVMPHVAPLPEGYDPDSYITQNGVEKFTELIENSSSWVDFYIDRTVNRYREGSLTMNQLLKEIGELLGKVKDPVEFNLGSKKASEKLGVRESEVRSFVKHGQSRGNTGRAKNVSYGSHEKLMLSILLKYPSLSSVIDKENWRQFIENQEIKSIMEEIISGGAHDLSNLLVHFNDRSEQEIISQILLSSDGIDDMETAGSMLASCVSKLKAAKVENRLKAIRLEMGLAAKDKDDLAEKRLLEEYLELMKQK